MVRTYFQILFWFGCVVFLESCSEAAAPRSVRPHTESQELATYKTVNGRPLNLWIHHPTQHAATDRHPAIVFFFGGGWKKGSPTQFRPHCQYFAARGMTAISADYRVQSRDGTTPVESTADAKSALRWVRAHATQLGIDPNRIAAGGGSAGGHLAAATATITGADDRADNLAVSPIPNALLLFNPVLDLTAPAWRGYWKMDLSFISPYHNLSGRLPPTLIFQGTADTVTPHATAAAFVEKAKRLGAANVQLVSFPGREHSFFSPGRNHGADFKTTLQQADAFFVSLGWLKLKTHSQ